MAGTIEASSHDGLVARSVSVRFGGLTALDGVSLDIKPNEIVGIIGPNGAGKTTLFNTICGFVRPDAGEISYGRAALGAIRPHELTRIGIARTLQSLGLWHGLTVLENVMAGARASARTGIVRALLGLPSSDREESRVRERAMEELAALGIAETAHRLPHELPYGTQKRVALARALVAGPSLLLLDEPASGLSEGEMASLGALLRDLRGRMAVALVEHHMDLVMQVCDRIFVLDFGKMIATGSPSDVKANPAVTAAYLGEEVADA